MRSRDLWSNSPAFTCPEEDETQVWIAVLQREHMQDVAGAVDVYQDGLLTFQHRHESSCICTRQHLAPLLSRPRGGGMFVLARLVQRLAKVSVGGRTTSPCKTIRQLAQLDILKRTGSGDEIGMRAEIDHSALSTKNRLRG